MSAAPDVSVIIPTHNVAPWIRECLSSILDDQDVDLEVIVVDDHSTDETRSLVAERAATDARLRLAGAPGSGGGQARNFGVELARGEYIAFCDGDDLVPQGSYAKMLASARRSGSDMVIGSFLKFWPTHTKSRTGEWAAFDEPRTRVRLADAPSLIRNRACWNRLFARRFWVENDLTFPTVARSCDVVPMTKALTVARRLDVIPDRVYLYRARPGNTSHTAQAGTPRSFASYLSQESQSGLLVRSLGEPKVAGEYNNMFFLEDGWVHLRRFLRELKDVPGTGADLEAISGNLASILRAVDEETVRAVPLNRRWVFVLAAAQRWTEARRLTFAMKPATASAPDIAWFAEQARQLVDSPAFSYDLLRQTVVSRLFRPLVREDTRPTIRTLTDLAEYPNELAQAFLNDIQRASPGVRQLLNALVGRDHTVLSDVASYGLFKLQVSSAEVRMRHVLLRARRSGPAYDELVIRAASDGKSREFTATHASGSRDVNVQLPFAELDEGNWSLQAVVRNGSTAVVFPLSVTADAIATDERGFARAVLHADGRDQKVSLEVRPSRLRRVARETRRVLDRRVLTASRWRGQRRNYDRTSHI